MGAATSGETRHARPCAGHPRLYFLQARKTWMAGTSPAMTNDVEQLSRLPRSSSSGAHTRDPLAHPPYELRVAGGLIERLVELQDFARRPGLHVLGDPAGQPHDAAPHFPVGDPFERRDKPHAFLR